MQENSTSEYDHNENPSVLYVLSYWFSVIFHPLFHFIYVFLVTIFLTPGNVSNADPVSLFIFSSLLFLNTTLFPIFGTYLLTGDIFLQKARKRTGAYAVTIFFYIIAYFFLWRMPVYDFIKAFMLSIICVMILLMALNLKWKISMHSTAGGSLIAFFVYLYYIMPEIYFVPLLISIIIAGLLGSSRLKLKVHNNVEIYAGYITGFTITAIVMGQMLP